MGNPPKPGPGRLDFSPRSMHPGLVYKVSDQIASEGEAVVASLKEAAGKNLDGPEAKFLRHVKGRMERTLRKIKDWESMSGGLPKGSQERIGLEKKINLEANVFRNEVAYWTVRTAKRTGGAGRRRRGARCSGCLEAPNG